MIEAKDLDDAKSVIFAQAKTQGLLRPKIEKLEEISEDELRETPLSDEPASDISQLN